MSRVICGEWFHPLPSQAELLASAAPETLYVGGVGSGKSLAGGFKALLHSLRCPGTVGLVGRQSYRALEDTTKRLLLEGDDKPPIIPAELVAERSEGKQSVRLLNGSQILFRSFQDWNLAKLHSLNLGWVYVDEAAECELAVWTTLLGRLRHPAGPRIAWASSNPAGHDWLWSRFHPDSAQRAAGVRLIHAQSSENVHLPEGYLARLRASMPEQWLRRYVDASFEAAAGQIFDEWDRAVHVLPGSICLPDGWRRAESLDHGRRAPTAYLQFALSPEGELVAEREYYSPGLVSAHAAAILLARADRRYPPIVADPQVFQADFSGRTIAEEYRERSEGTITFMPASTAVAPGLLRVAELLHRRPGDLFPAWHPFAGTAGPDGRGAPALYVSERCANLIRELPEYAWRDLGSARADELPEAPRKQNDHAVDALRYFCMSRRARASAEPVEPADRDPDEARMLSAGLLERVF